MKNQSNEKMYFNVGYHPGFNCPFDDKHTVADYTFEFEKAESPDMLVCVDAFNTGEKERLFENKNTIALTENLFDNDSIAMDNLNSKWVKLVEKDTGRNIKLEIAEFPFVLLWSNDVKPMRFVCIEPWHGINDFSDAKPEISQKYGMQVLDVDGEYQTDLSMQFED